MQRIGDRAEPIRVNFPQRPAQGFTRRHDTKLVATDASEAMRGQTMFLQRLQNGVGVFRHGRNDNTRLGFVEENLLEATFCGPAQIDRGP